MAAAHSLSLHKSINMHVCVEKACLCPVKSNKINRNMSAQPQISQRDGDSLRRRVQPTRLSQNKTLGFYISGCS